MQNNYCIKIVKLHPLPPLLWNKTKPEKPSKHWANEPAQLARKTTSAFAFPVPVCVCVCGGVCVHRLCWYLAPLKRPEQVGVKRLFSNSWWCTRHWQPPTLPAHPLQIITEKRILWGSTWAEHSALSVCAAHIPLYKPLSQLQCVFFFFLSNGAQAWDTKWWRATVNEEGRGDFPHSRLSHIYPDWASLTGTMTGSQISKECSLREILPIEPRFLFYFQHCRLNDTFFLFDGIFLLCGIYAVCIFGTSWFFFIAFSPVAYWVAGFFFVVFVLFCFWFFKQWNVSNFISSAFNKF